YNEQDCTSTERLRDWLWWLRPLPRLPAKEGDEWFMRAGGLGPDLLSSIKSARTSRIQTDLEKYRSRLAGSPPHQALLQPLHFHRRAAKPEWWAYYERMDYGDDDALEDLECLGGLRLHHGYLPVPMKQSLAFTFSFPEQETKLRVGDDCVRIDTGERLG